MSPLEHPSWGHGVGQEHKYPPGRDAADKHACPDTPLQGRESVFPKHEDSRTEKR